MTRYAIAYDVSSDTLRKRIRTVCRQYGARQQFSLFEVEVSPTERAELKTEIEAIVSGADAAETARVRMYSVGPPDNDIRITNGPEEDNEPANIV